MEELDERGYAVEKGNSTLDSYLEEDKEDEEPEE